MTAPLTRREAIAYTQGLLAKHGLRGWTVRINERMTRTYGRCTYTPRIIELSGPLLEVNPAGRTEETARHEVAHALAGPDAGHGPDWKDACRVVGADPVRCYRHEDVTPAAQARWEGVCAACGQVIGTRTRTPRQGHHYHKATSCPHGRYTTIAERRIAWRDRYQTPAAVAANAEEESIMAGKYTIGIVRAGQDDEVITRARKDDALKVAHAAEGADRWVVRSPSGKVVEEWTAPADTPAPVKHRRVRIPEGATEHKCDGCGHVLPVTKFPTTRDKTRLTECRGCRDARRKASV